MPDVKNPYGNTPYDALSFPDHPEVGVITPFATAQDIKDQRRKITPRLRHPRQVAEAVDKLRGINRVVVDAFLVSPFNLDDGLDKITPKFLNRSRQAPVIKLPEIGVDGLNYYYSFPLTQTFKIKPVGIEPIKTYEKPLTDIANVTFDL